MLKKISIFWIIFGALLVTSAVPLALVSARAIDTTSTEVESTQRDQLRQRVQAHADTINEQFRQFEITTAMAATRSREVLQEADVRYTAPDSISTDQDVVYGEDPIGVLGLDNFYANLSREDWENLGFEILEADLEALEMYATRLGSPLSEDEWAAYGFTVSDEAATDADAKIINRADIPTTWSAADFQALGFTIISGNPNATPPVITADQIGRVPSPEVINVSNVYLNSLRSGEALSQRTRAQIETTAQLDDLFGTIRNEDFGSQWVYLTTREGMMRLYPWHPNQYGPPYVWRVWEPQTIVFYTAASDQGVIILRTVEGETELVQRLSDTAAINYFRSEDFPSCGNSIGDESCALDCSGNSDLVEDYCSSPTEIVILSPSETPNLVRNTAAVSDSADVSGSLCYGDGRLQDGYSNGPLGDDADLCYVDCSDSSDPLTAQFCTVNCAISDDPLHESVCGERVNGIIALDGIVQIEESPVPGVSSTAIEGITTADYPACPQSGVTSSACYLDCANAEHPLHAQYCRQPTWTAPYYDYAGQGLMVTNSIPIWAEGEDTPIAVMSHDLRIDVLEQQVLNFEVGEEGLAFLLDSAGQIIAHRNYQASQYAEEQALIGASVFRLLSEAEPNMAAVVGEIVGGGSGVADYEDADGKTWIVAFAEIESTGWHIGLAQPRDEIIAPATKITGDVLLGTVTAIGVVLIVGFFLARGITRPVSRLSETAKEIESSVDDETNALIGDNLETLKHVSSAKEIANLSQVFEQMVKALQKRMVELNSIYAMGQTITANVEYDTVLQAVLNAVKTVVAYDAAEISILKGNSLTVEAWDGQEGFNDTTGRKYRLGRGPTGQIGEQKKSLLISTVSSGEDIQRTLGYSSPGSEFLAKTTKVIINSFLGIPLMIGDRLIGTLTLVHRDKGFFTPDDERQLNKLAAQATVAIQNAIQVREREKQLKQQIEELKIEIDQAKVSKQIEEVTDSDFFRQLQGNARQMRRRFGKSVEDTDSTERTDSQELLSALTGEDDTGSEERTDAPTSRAEDQDENDKKETD